MTAARFVHTALNCKDIEAIERFYTTHLGFERARLVDLGTTRIVFIKNGDAYLELFEAQGESPFPKGEKDGPTFDGLRHFAFEVDDVAAKLKEMGEAAHVTLGPMDFGDFIPGWKAVWIADPEGNIIELNQGYRDQEKPPPLDA